MKKLFAVLALVGVMTSCKSKKKDEKKPEETTTTTDATTPTTDVAPASGETPKFSDADVQAYADSYATYAEAYKKAAESKDMSKLAELGKMGQDIATKAAAISQKVGTSPDDLKKLGEFVTAKSAEIVEYTKKLTGQ